MIPTRAAPLLVAAMACLFPASSPGKEESRPDAVVPDLPPAVVTVSDEARATAVEAYADARSRYARGDLPGALAAAEAAWRALPNASTALIRGTILAKMKRQGEAFEAFLAARDLDPTDGELTLIEDGLARSGPLCSPPMGWARLTVTPARATVTTGGVRFVAPRTVGLRAGDRALHVDAPGYAPLDATLSVRAGRETVAQLVLPEIPEAPGLAPTVYPLAVAPTASAQPPEPPAVRRPQAAVAAVPRVPAWRRALPWTLVGAGGAMIATAVGMHVWALDAAADTRTYAKPVDGMTEAQRRSRFDSADSAMRVRGTAAYVLYGVGAAAAMSGAVILIVDRVRAPAPVVIGPAVGMGGAAVSISGGF